MIHHLFSSRSSQMIRQSSHAIQSNRIHRLYSSTPSPFEAIRILWASQGGTAQLFGQELQQALEESLPQADIVLHGWHEFPPNELLSEDATNILLTSVSGFGEPPDNGREFYEYLTSNTTALTTSNGISERIQYSVFGLGNSKAHPNHYNTVGKMVDEALASLGATRVHPLGLGDDGDCIEDDFDVWMESIVQTLKNKSQTGSTSEGTDVTSMETRTTAVLEPTPAAVLSHDEASHDRVLCPAAKSEDGLRRVSIKYPQLHLQPSTRDNVCHDLFHLQGTDRQFYAQSTTKARVLQSQALSAYGGEAGLREIVVSIQNQSYETGDHCLVYPRNDNFLVEAYLQHLDVDPHAVIETQDPQYPYPTGLTVYETLSHCIDLGAPPSPSFARKLLNRSQIDYKQEIAVPRCTILSLLLQGGTQLALEDLLYQVTPMKPRYYSIASSPLEDATQVRLTFRPVKYVTTQGHMREGICTNYMGSMRHAVEEEAFQYMAVTLLSNPSFRLPSDPQTPILLIAGGCGVAPIRAFCEERILLRQKYQVELGPGTLFLGFRSPEDQVYDRLVQKALSVGALTDAKVAYSSGWKDSADHAGYCGHVNGLVRAEAEFIWEHFQAGGITYLCGGARTFGAAVERELLEILQERGNLDFDEASAYLRRLVEHGKLLEDLAD